jgi:hypothetical protein
MVPPGHGPAGGVFLSAQVQFTEFSVTDQVICGVQVEQKPFTAACNVTWPFAATVADAGVTVTVTLLGLYPPPLPQPTATISRTTVPAKMVCLRLITRLRTKCRLNFLGGS